MRSDVRELSDSTGLLEPISAQERILPIDVLRGFALFGVLAANMRGFGSPVGTYFSAQLMWPGTPDRLAQGIIDLLITGKFITLFSFLFGLGFAIQMTRAESGGARFGKRFCRRLLGLLMIGLAHAFFLWWGDILAPYALIGLALLLFWKRSQATVLVWAAALMLFPLLPQMVFLGLQGLHIQLPRPPPLNSRAVEETVRSYAQGSFAEIMEIRRGELIYAYSGLLFYFVPTLGKFLFGLYAWRRGVFLNITEHLDFWRLVLRLALPVGLICNLAAVLNMNTGNADSYNSFASGLLVHFSHTLGVSGLSAAYASAIILMYARATWRRRLEPLALLGRMALSNYLLQSVVCTTLFYSYGFGLYGRVGPALGLLPTFLIFLAQIPLSAWWLRRYRFGPVEWLLRSFTYGKAQPMRLERAHAAQ